MTGHGPRHLAARVGRWSARHRKLAIGGWLAFVLVSFLIGSAIGTSELSDVEGATGESGRAEKILSEAGFPNTDSELVLIQGKTSRGLEQAIAQARRALRGTPGVTSIEDVERSDDGRTALVPFDYGGSDIDEPLAAVDAVQRANPGFYIAELGDRSADQELDETVGTDFKRAEYFSIPITLAILLVAFGSLIAAAVPLLVALTSVAAALGLLSVVSQIAPADDAAGSVILLIGLAVGVDYSLFYLRREREERAAGRDSRAALDAAAATSGHAVLVSGLTVLIAMAGMLVSGSREIASVGVGAMLVVIVALVGSLTVLPAALSALGDRVERGRIPLLGSRKPARSGSAMWDTLVGRVMRRPAWAALIAAAPLVALSAVALGLHTVDPSLSSLPQKLSIVETYKRLEQAFPGDSEPAEVVVRAQDIDTPQVQRAFEMLERQTEVFDVDVNPARTVAVVHVSLPGNGTDAASERGLANVRDLAGRTLGEVPGVEVAVTGTTAESADFNRLLKERAPLVFAFVLGLSFLLLLLAFRSLVLAAKAVLLNLLSVGAAYGLLVVVFQHGVGESLLDFESNGGVIAWLPLFLFIVLFGLSMDYHVFILSRVREGVDRGDSTEHAVAHAVTSTAGTVTSAAVVMVAVFAIFATLSSLEMKQLGVGLAAAILIDATIVRAVLLPAAMKLLGDWNWYLPGWLQWLPRLGLHTEGTGYSAQRPTPEKA